MVTDLAGQSSFKVSETGADFSFMIDFLYCGSPKQPPISEATVEILSELAQKYAMVEIASHCDWFLAQLTLDLGSLPRWHAVGAKLKYSAAMAHCRNFVADGDNFEQLEKCVRLLQIVVRCRLERYKDWQSTRYEHALKTHACT